MPSVDPRAADIIVTIAEFEESVVTAESALVARDWPQLDALLSAQRRLTHLLANALDETRDARPPAFTEELNRRLAGISKRRGDQLRRLIAFNHAVNERLAMISRSREMRRVNVERESAPRVLDTLQ